MAIQKFKTHLYFVQYEGGDGHFCCFESETMGKGDHQWTYVKPVEYEVEIPDDFDPRPQQIAALREMKREEQAKFAKRVMELDAQIQSLLAIEMVAA